MKNLITLLPITLFFIATFTYIGCDKNTNDVVYHEFPYGAVHQVEDYMVQEYLMHPDNYHPLDWGRLELIEDTFRVHHTYRAMEVDSQMVTESMTFYLDSVGTVIKIW